MPLTKDFKETIVERAKRDEKFRRGMLKQGIEHLIAGDEDDVLIGKCLLRDYINATIGFVGLSEKTRIPKQSLMRMLSATGNPSLNKLNQVMRTLLKSEGIVHLCSL